MDTNYPLVESEFDKLTFKDQKQVIADCMGQHKIPWTDVLKHMYPQFEDKIWLSYLIEQYKLGNGDMVRSPYTDTPAAGKRTFTKISPPKPAEDATASAADNQTNFEPKELFGVVGGGYDIIWYRHRRLSNAPIPHAT